MPLPLDGKTALVTGASRGIGRAIALRLARDGARVAVHFGRDREAADRTVAEIVGAGGAAQAFAADLAAPDTVAALFAALDAAGYGALDILVNSAGIAEGASVSEAGGAALGKLFAVNVTALWEVTHHAAGRLRDGGRIVNLTSGVTRHTVMPAFGAYAATKAAVDQFTFHWAHEFGVRGITVNSVAPGNIATDMNGFDKDPTSREAVLGQQVLKRVGLPDDIADVVAFLAGPDSRWITGQRLEASGGWQL